MGAEEVGMGVAIEYGMAAGVVMAVEVGVGVGEVDAEEEEIGMAVGVGVGVKVGEKKGDEDDGGGNGGGEGILMRMLHLGTNVQVWISNPEASLQDLQAQVPARYLYEEMSLVLLTFVLLLLLLLLFLLLLSSCLGSSSWSSSWSWDWSWSWSWDWSWDWVVSVLLLLLLLLVEERSPASLGSGCIAVPSPSHALKEEDSDPPQSHHFTLEGFRTTSIGTSQYGTSRSAKLECGRALSGVGRVMPNAMRPQWHAAGRIFFVIAVVVVVCELLPPVDIACERGKGVGGKGGQSGSHPDNPPSSVSLMWRCWWIIFVLVLVFVFVLVMLVVVGVVVVVVVVIGESTEAKEEKGGESITTPVATSHLCVPSSSLSLMERKTWQPHVAQKYRDECFVGEYRLRPTSDGGLLLLSSLAEEEGKGM
jgi:hypothetical protein